MEKILILDSLGDGSHTANECMDKVYFDDQKKRIIRDTCRFYNHLNKHFAPLERSGYIKMVGTKKGPTGKIEKIWKVTKAGQNFLERNLAA